jgi:surfeit locus 1 family protein
LRYSTIIAPRKAVSIAWTRPSRRQLLRWVIASVVVLAGVAALISLGNWQLRRLAWKEDIIARAAQRPAGAVQDLPSASAWPMLDVADGEYRPYRFSGHFLHDKEALVFTSLPEPKGRFGGPGFWVVTPFALDDGGTVLINRGFAPQGRHLPADRGELLSSAAATVVGLMRQDEGRHMFLPDDRPAENMFYARDIGNISAAKGVAGPVAPFTIDLISAEAPAGGLPQAGETRLVFANNHLQYALTWYGLAAALLGVFAAFLVQRLRGRHSAASLTQVGDAP